MRLCVLDSSAALAFVLPGEAEEIGSAFFEQLIREGATVTCLWPLEVGHVLLRAERRGRITSEERQSAMRVLKSLPLRVDAETTAHAWTESLALAEAHGLSLYDASYLEAALRLQLPLATRDVPLAAAAAARGVAVLS